jgi:gas vesicle protein
MDNSRTLAVAIAGAAIGAVAAYLFFTDEGRQIRRRLEPAIDDLAREFSSFRATIENAAMSAGMSYPASRQTSPF